MASESARATTAEEARFRIADANSVPRAIKVIALDAGSERIVKRIAALDWNQATFLTSSSFAGAPHDPKTWSMTGWLGDLAGRAKNLAEEIASADLIVMVASAGTNPVAASVIGEACSLKRVTTTALILDAGAVSDAALSQTLSQLRPHATMVVVASGEDYVEAMLVALRA